MLATVVQLMGEEKGMAYMKALNGQMKNYQNPVLLLLAWLVRANAW